VMCSGSPEPTKVCFADFCKESFSKCFGHSVKLTDWCMFRKPFILAVC
jgi:hypothetical protein